MNLHNELKNLIARGASKYPIPFKKGSSIFLGKCVIRKTKNGYLCFNTMTKEQIGQFETKYGSLAAIKNPNNTRTLQEIKWLDKRLARLQNDIVFYSHSLQNNNDPRREVILENRKEDCEHKIDTLKIKLESIIFDK